MADITGGGGHGSIGPGSKPLTPSGSGPIVQRNNLYICVDNPSVYPIFFSALTYNGLVTIVDPPAPAATQNGTTAAICITWECVTFNMPPNTHVNLLFNQQPVGIGIETGIIYLILSDTNLPLSYDPKITYDDTILPTTDNLITITYHC